MKKIYIKLIVCVLSYLYYRYIYRSQSWNVLRWNMMTHKLVKLSYCMSAETETNHIEFAQIRRVTFLPYFIVISLFYYTYHVP